MTRTVNIKIKRIYDPPEDSDGLRVLVDRLWPRGLKKADAGIDVWAKQLAPSSAIRTGYGHQVHKFTEFRKRYLEELMVRHDEAQTLLTDAGDRPVTLLYAASDTTCNNAVILREYFLANFNCI